MNRRSRAPSVSSLALVLALAVASFAGAPASAAEPIANADGIALTPPDGFTVARDDDGRLVLVGPGDEGARPSIVVTLNTLARMTPDAYFTEIARLLGDAYGATETGREEREGTSWLTMRASYEDDAKRPLESRFHLALFDKRAVLIQETASGDHWEALLPVFDATFASFTLGDPDPSIARLATPPAPAPAAEAGTADESATTVAPGDPGDEPSDEPAVATDEPATSIDEPAATDEPAAPEPTDEPAAATEPAPGATDGAADTPDPAPGDEGWFDDEDPAAGEGSAVEEPPAIARGGPPPARTGPFRIERVVVQGEDDAGRAADAPVEIAAGETLTIKLRPRDAARNDKGEHWIEVGLHVIDRWKRVVLDKGKFAEHIGRPPPRPLVTSMTCRVELPADFPPGEYRLVLFVRDRIDGVEKTRAVSLLVPGDPAAPADAAPPADEGGAAPEGGDGGDDGED